MLVAFCALLLVIRLFVFPRIEDYRERIVATLSANLGQPVAISAIATGWDGWNPRLTILNLQVHDRGHPKDEPLVSLPRVDFVVSWTSLPLMDLRLKQLTIDRPQLSVRRDVNGRLHLAGIEIDPDRQSDDPRAMEWLLRQQNIVVTEALLTWTDELRRAPQLVLDHVQFRLERSQGHHRFGLVGTPPAELASPLDFRGDVTDASLKDWRDAHGTFYVRLDYADIALWREWIPLPIAIDNGKGALRAWFDFAGGAPTGMVADFELADVRTWLGRDLPQLDLTNLGGHLDWKRGGGKRLLSASNLAFTTRAGVVLPPTDFKLALTESADGTINGGNLTFERLDADPLTALAAHLPLPEGWRRELARFAPRGIVHNGKFNWTGAGDAPTTYAASGVLQRFGYAASGGSPGVTGLSGRFDVDHTRGSVTLDSRDLQLHAPGVWNDPLNFTKFEGGVSWVLREGRWQVALNGLRFASVPFTGVANGTWIAKESGPGALDLNAQLVAANVAEVTRYMPLSLDGETRTWLVDSLRQGTVSDVRVNVAGDLTEFPFPGNRNGKFLIAFKVKDTTLRFLPDWPPIEGLDAELRFEGQRMTIDATRGRSLGAQLGPTKAEIADLSAAIPVLNVTGDASGPTAEFLRYIAQSPVDGWIGHATEGASAAGNGKLTLKLTIPLGKGSDTKVAGDYQFNGNDVRLQAVPSFSRVNGRIAFTEQDLRAQEVSFEALGGTGKLAITKAEGRLRIAGSGTANLAALRREFDVPALARLSGTTDWQVNWTSLANVASWSLESSMQGAVVAYPAPLAKSAAEIAPLKIERQEIAGRPNEDLLIADYRGLVRVAAHRVVTPTAATPDRVVLLLGESVGAIPAPTRPGIAVRGALPALDLDEWLALYAAEKPFAETGGSSSPPALAMNGVDLQVGRLEVFGRVLHELNVSAQREGEDWQLALRGREMDGHATWRGPSAALPNGRVSARLTRLVPPGHGELRPVRSAPDASGKSANPWPELDIVADTFLKNDRDLGKLELVAQPIGSDWRIAQLSLSNADGAIDANGWWRVKGDKQQTQLEATVDVKDAGGYLAHFGFSDAVRNAPTKITGNLQWTGAPNDFDYPSLTGTFTMKSGAGQFTKIDPGIGKLLGVLSLQALPRRITLDFRDIFSEGFAFDDINGDFTIDNGQMRTDNLKLVGPAAAVALKGDLDLAKETQRLDVRVQPALSSSLSAGAAVLFIANPLVGLGIGAGALIAQKLFNNPIEQMFSYEYRVTGAWADPVVERVNGRVAATKSPVEQATETK